MNFLKKLLRSNGSIKDYDYYVIQKRQGGIYGKWETIEEQPDFLDSAVGVATYGDGMDATLRCLGVKKFRDREIKKQLWQHISREDVDEEIEERRKRVGKKGREDDFEKYYRIIKETREEERTKNERVLETETTRSERDIKMIQDFYEKYFELYNSLVLKNSESNKYSVWQQGIHELSEVGKEIIHELQSGSDDSKDENGGDESFDEYKRKALPPAKKKNKDGEAGKGNPRAELLLMAKYIENNGSPLSFLETIAITFPKTYKALASVKNLEELLEKLKPFKNKIPVLGTEEAKVWLGSMLEIILNQETKLAENEKPYKAENDDPVPVKTTGAEVESDTKEVET